MNIPEHWTAEEALTIAALLEELIEAIWKQHGRKMGKWMNTEYGALPIPPAPLQSRPDHTIDEPEVPF